MSASSETNAGGSERYVVLDSCRGLAAIMVALFHYPMHWHFLGSNFVRGCWLFVDFFFVLSGFVIAHAYAGKLSTPRHLEAFIVRRVGRLWPLHVVLLGYFVAAAGLKYLARSMGADIEVTSNPNNTLYSFITNFFLLHSFGLHSTVTWNFTSWSISAEFLTNLIFGVCFLLVPVRRIAASLALSAAGLAVLLVFSEKTIDTANDFGLFRCMYGFFLGYVVYRIVTADTGPKLHGYGAASAAEIAVLIAVAAFVTFGAAEWWRLFAPFLFAVAVWIFAAEQGAVSRMLKLRPFVVIGMLSYSIYMTHMAVHSTANTTAAVVAKVIGRTATQWWETNIFANPWWMDAVLPFFLAMAVLVSWFTYNWVEVPWRRWFNRIANRISPKREIVPLGFDELEAAQPSAVAARPLPAAE
jgi:peptidoglycan/LPS O-acetylase OafA/YrhL